MRTWKWTDQIDVIGGCGVVLDFVIGVSTKSYDSAENDALVHDVTSVHSHTRSVVYSSTSATSHENASVWI
jgi:hypothetical protein